jgi:hypothetical protein
VDRITRFCKLHSSRCSVMPNPWDLGSARTRFDMGFAARAPTSSRHADTLGRTDQEVTLSEKLSQEHGCCTAQRRHPAEGLLCSLSDSRRDRAAHSISGSGCRRGVRTRTRECR